MVRPYLKELMEEGMLALPAGSTVLRLPPPLIIEEDELEAVRDKLVKVLSRPRFPG
jgi:acetylornithine/succinyldiaminopimelate/putrescine aminotransferase